MILINYTLYIQALLAFFLLMVFGLFNTVQTYYKVTFKNFLVQFDFQPILADFSILGNINAMFALYHL